MRGLRAQHFDGQRRQVACGAGVIERGGEVGRGVSESAVEVEQDGFNHGWGWHIGRGRRPYAPTRSMFIPLKRLLRKRAMIYVEYWLFDCTILGRHAYMLKL